MPTLAFNNYLIGAYRVTKASYNVVKWRQEEASQVIVAYY